MLRVFATSFIAFLLAASPAIAQNKYDPGASDSEIVIGNLMPYSGPFSEYGSIGRAEAAYFQMLNDKGGIKGRKIRFVSLDAGPNFRNSLDLAHQLVEERQVLFIAGAWGSLTNRAIRTYMNEMKVPQLFVASNESAFEDPEHFPWTMGFAASKRTEGLAYANYILSNRPHAKIAILYSEGEDGLDYLDGLHAGLGDSAKSMIVKEARFDYHDPATIDAEVAELKNSGADLFINLTIGRFATQVIRKAYDIDWHPLQLLPNASLSIAAFLEPAGLQKSAGIITNARSKGWLHAGAASDPAVKDFLEFMHKYNAQADIRDANNVYGYEVAQAVEAVLKKCGDDLTRANVMKQATSLDLELGILRPGIRIKTSPTDYRPIKDLFLIQFNGKDWVAIGGVIGPRS